MKKDKNDEMYSIPDAPFPIFDTQLSIQENLTQSAQLKIPTPQLPQTQHPHKFFDYTIQHPLGIPACPITGSSAYIRLLAQLGFSVFTHKTIRSFAHPPHPFPHTLPVSYQLLSHLDLHTSVMHSTDQQPTLMNTLALANSIGNSSDMLAASVQGIADSRAALNNNQILIASIYGAATNTRTLVDDWTFLACTVVEAGAHAVEANFSCPNLHDNSPIYCNLDLMQQIIKNITTAINPIPLIIKVGISNNAQQMETMMCAAACAGARGICGINSVSTQILNEHHQPAFGTRTTAGISGAPIFNLAVKWIQHAYYINKKHNLDLTILGTGGITLPEQFDSFFDAGADIAMSGTGTMWDPYLATRYIKRIYNANISTLNTHYRNMYEHPAQ